MTRPHEMTYSEHFADWLARQPETVRAKWAQPASAMSELRLIACERIRCDLIAEHKGAVEAALLAGEDVPERVLAAYPDLRERD